MDVDGQLPASDLGAGSLHTRSKVILAQISWLLGIGGITETDGVEFAEDGYRQRYMTAAKIPVEVSVAPSEPLRIGVMFQTRPPAAFKVDAIDEDGRSMEVTAISNRVVQGIRQLSKAFKADEPNDPVVSDDDSDPRIVPTVELNPQARAGASTSVSRRVISDFGDVDAQSQVLGFGDELGADGTTDVGVRSLIPPQFAKQVAALSVRCSRIGGMEGCQKLLDLSAYQAKKGTPAELVTALQKVQKHLLDLQASSPREAVISKGVLRQVIALIDALNAVKDARKKPSDDADTALERLRAVVKPENVLPSPYVGDLGGTSSRNFIGARNRTPGAFERLKSDAKSISEGPPEKDGLKGVLTPEQERDFVSLLREVVYSYKPGTIVATWDSRLMAWSVRSIDWSVSFRVDDRTSAGGQMVAFGILGKKTETVGFLSGRKTKIEVLEKFQKEGDSYDDLGIQVALKIVSLLRKHGLGGKRE